MARTVLTVLLIVLLNVFVGCNGAYSGRGRLMPARTGQPAGAASIVRDASEADIAEHVAVNRRAYRQGLELLVKRYARMGDNMKLQWAQKELAALEAIPQYSYIIEAGPAGPDLKANASIPEADYIYRDILEIEKKARGPFFIVDENLLRAALNKCNLLIRKHPSSDKIGDAAYKAGVIHEHFREYTLAALYYQRACQWDPMTIYPAAFKAAHIMDRRLLRKAEALELYQQFVKGIAGSEQQKKFAEKRIKELTQSDKETE